MNEVALLSQEVGKYLYNNAEEAIKALLLEDQAEAPVVHRFGPGTYLREAHYPAGTIIFGHVHRHEHLNIFVKGKLQMLKPDGTVEVMTAPMTFVGQPGRKIAVIEEDVIWQNVWATDIRDLDELEAWCYDMPKFWLAHKELLEDKTAGLLANFEVIEQLVIPVPDEWVALTIRKTQDGRVRVVTPVAVQAMTILGPAKIGDKLTVAGLHVAVGQSPNVELVEANGTIWFRSLHDILGCLGGGSGTELIVGNKEILK